MAKLCLCFILFQWILFINADEENILHIGVLFEEPDGAVVQYLKNVTNLAHENTSKIRLNFKETPSSDIFTTNRQACAFMREGAFPIISFSPCQTNHLVYDVVAPKHIPLLISDGACQRPINSSFWMDNGSYLTSIKKVILETIINVKWKEIIIFYDDEKDPKWLNDLILDSSEESIVSIIMKVDSDASLDAHTNLFLHKENFMVLCSKNTTKKLLQEVKIGNLHLLGPHYNWLIVADYQMTEKESNDFLEIFKEGDNVAMINQVVLKNQLTIQQQVDRMIGGVFNASHRILQNESWSNLSQLDCSTSETWDQGDIFAKYYREYQRKFPEWKIWNKQPQFEIKTLMAHKEGHVDFNLIGYWNSQDGLKMHDYLFPLRNQGFNNRTFRIATMHAPPFIIRYPNGTFAGLCFDILEELARAMNFSYIIYEPEDQKWGILQDDGSYTGMIGMIDRKEVDFGVGHFSVTEEREKAVDFTTPWFIDNSIIVMKKPDGSTQKIFICFGPFSNEVWAAVTASVLVVGFFMWLFHWMNPLHLQLTSDSHQHKGVCSFLINLWQCYGALMQQGMVYIPDNHSARIMIALWWFYTIVLVGTYNGNLIAILTAPVLESPVDSLEELAASSMKFGFTRDTALHGVFKHAETDPYHTLWNKIKTNQPNMLVNNELEGFNKVFDDENYAYIIEEASFKTLHTLNNSISNSSCELVRSEESFFPSMYAFPFQKNSPYTQLFSLGIMKIREAGLIKRWGRKWYTLTNKCTGLERTTAQTNISLLEAQGAFYILAIGIFIGLILLVIEWCCVKRKMKGYKPNKNDLSNNKDPEKTLSQYVTTNGIQTRECLHQMPVTSVQTQTQSEIQDDQEESSGDEITRLSSVFSIDDIPKDLPYFYSYEIPNFFVRGYSCELKISKVPQEKEYSLDNDTSRMANRRLSRINTYKDKQRKDVETGEFTGTKCDKVQEKRMRANSVMNLNPLA